MTLPYHPLRDSPSAVTEPTWAHLVWRSLINHYVPEQKLTIHNALDLGTGYGHVVSVGSEHYGINVFGVDIRPEIYQGPKGRFIQADLLNTWPFKDGSFDLVLEHLVFDDLISLQKKACEDVAKHFNSELNRVVREGGIFFSHNSGFHPESPFHLVASDTPFRVYQK
ncbi:class I SAM-dependent methyltransferase [Candidatus Woesearchaeota archaeon]|nr:class I SAM-dependent methyltransferase [Candidatus Woesearchaeota archaeon]